MPWFDFECEKCQARFDLIVSSAETDRVKCPNCADGGKPKKLISGFRVAGRGDLRESSEFHGCHRPVEGESHGHVHGPGCGHSSSKPPSGNSGSDPK